MMTAPAYPLMEVEQVRKDELLDPATKFGYSRPSPSSRMRAPMMISTTPPKNSAGWRNLTPIRCPIPTAANEVTSVIRPMQRIARRMETSSIAKDTPTAAASMLVAIPRINR